MRLSITVNPDLLEQAKSLAGLRTKREVIEIALREMILNRRLQEMVQLEGSGLVETDLKDLMEWRDKRCPNMATKRRDEKGGT